MFSSFDTNNSDADDDVSRSSDGGGGSSSNSNTSTSNDSITIISSDDDYTNVEPTIEHPLHPSHPANTPTPTTNRSPWAMFGETPNIREAIFQHNHHTRTFVQTLSAIAISSYKEASPTLRDQVEYGNKVLLPASSLEKLTRLDIEYPMMFSVTTTLDEQKTHCGVLEFSAPEGMAILPSWMMERLQISPSNSLATFKNISLPAGSFIRLQAQSLSFLEITDPKAVLEHSLRNFACLTLGDRIKIRYNDEVYGLLVEAVEPESAGSNGISVVETDLSVDFSAPVGYEEVERKMKKDAEDAKSILTYCGISGDGGHERKGIINLPKGCVYYGIRTIDDNDGSSDANGGKENNNQNSDTEKPKPHKLK